MNWVSLPDRRPWLILLAAAITVGACLFAVLRLKPSGSLTLMFPASHASARAMAAVAERFAGTDSLLIVATSESGDAAALLGFADRLASQLRSDPDAQPLIASIRHGPSPEFRSFVEKVVAPSLIYYLDDAGMDELRRRLTPDSMAQSLSHAEEMLAAAGPAGDIAKALARDPLSLRELVADRLMPDGVSLASGNFSSDGRSLLIQVVARRPVSDMDSVDALMKAVRSAAGRANSEGLSLDYCGAYAIAEVAQREIRSDMIGSVTGSILLMQLLYLLVYRRLLAFPLVFVPMAIGTLVGFAVAAVIARAITPPTAVAGAVLAGLGIDYSTHYLSHYHSRSGGGGANVGREIGPALLGGCATSAIAFATIGLSDIPALRDFALIGSVGLIACLIATMTVLPAMLRLIPQPASGFAASRLSVVSPIESILQRHRWLAWATWAFLVATVLTTALTWKSDAVLEPDLNSMHPRPNPPLELQRSIASRFFSAPDPLLIHLTADSPEQLLRRSHELRSHLEPSALAPHVAGTLGLANLLPDPARTMARESEARSIDADRVEADFMAAVERSGFDPAAMSPYARYLKAMLRPGPAPGMEALRDFPRIADQLLPRGVGQDEALTLLFLRDPMEDRVTRDATIAAVREGMGAMEGATLTGLPVVAHDVEGSIYRDMARLLTVATWLVVLWLVVQYRSIRDVLLAMFPMLFGVAVVGLMLGLGLARLNMVNLITIPMLIGLGVDYGIFLVSAARRVRQQGGGRNELVHELATSCDSVIVCSLTTIFGFGSLIFTSTPAVRSLGLLIGVGVTAALVATLLGLAPLLTRLSSRGPHAR